jgi:hypothetical protein
MKIAFLGVRVPGHLNPMTTLARKLKARGHDVVFLSVPDTEPFVRAAELPFIPFCENNFPVGSLAKSMAALSKLQGQAALEMAIKSVANTMESAFVCSPYREGDFECNRDLTPTIEEAIACGHRSPDYSRLSHASCSDLEQTACASGS